MYRVLAEISTGVPHSPSSIGTDRRVAPVENNDRAGTVLLEQSDGKLIGFVLL